MDARVVQLALRLKQSDQHRVLAALLLAVRIELLEEVLVLVLGGRGVVLILHLEHDRDDLVTGLIALAEDEVALGAVGGVVVLLEVGMRERRGTQLIELSLAVLLEGLAHHLGGKAHLHIAQALDFLVLIADEVLSALAGPQLIELSLAVLLEGLAHHLGGKAHLHIAQALDFLVLIADEVLSALAGPFDLERMGGLDLLLLGGADLLLMGSRSAASRRRGPPAHGRAPCVPHRARGRAARAPGQTRCVPRLPPG